MTSETTILQRGEAMRLDLDPGDDITILDPSGNAGGDLTFLGYDQALTRDIVGFERRGLPVKIPFFLEPGDSMYDAEGTPHLKVEDIQAPGKLDNILPGCRRALYEDGRPGCRDIIPAAMGIPVKQLTGMVSFWVNATTDQDYYDPFGPQTTEPNRLAVFSAVRPVIVGISACPDTLIWDVPERELHVTVRRSA